MGFFSAMLPERRTSWIWLSRVTKHELSTSRLRPNSNHVSDNIRSNPENSNTVCRQSHDNMGLEEADIISRLLVFWNHNKRWQILLDIKKVKRAIQNQRSKILSKRVSLHQVNARSYVTPWHPVNITCFLIWHGCQLIWHAYTDLMGHILFHFFLPTGQLVIRTSAPINTYSFYYYTTAIYKQKNVK